MRGKDKSKGREKEIGSRIGDRDYRWLLLRLCLRSRRFSTFDFPVVEVGDLLTMEHISKMNVVIIAMVMEECSSHYFREMYLATPSLTYSGNSALKC